MRRGLGDDLVIAPYATALAAMIEPVAAVENLRRLSAEGVNGPYGFYDAVDYTAREVDSPRPSRRGANAGSTARSSGRQWPIIRA